MKGSIQSNSTRSRRKLNYNYIYNNKWKRNGFLSRHPSNRRIYGKPEQNMSMSMLARAYQTSTLTREALTQLGSTPESVFQVQSTYIVEDSFNLEIESQSFEEIINESEDGEILAIECVMSSPILTVEVVTYGLGNTPFIINNYSINEMLRRGRGMTPGSVETLPNFRGKDPVGIPRKFYPYVGRCKVDNLADHLGDSREYYVFVYEPDVHFPYSAIIINIKNTSTQGKKIVDSINIHRRVFGPTPPGLIENATPFDSSILYQPEPEIAVEEEPIVESTTVTNPYFQSENPVEPEPVYESNVIESDDY